MPGPPFREGARGIAVRFNCSSSQVFPGFRPLALRQNTGSVSVTARVHHIDMNDLLRIAGHVHSALPLDVLTALSLLSVAPFVLVLTTSFVRIVVVLSLVRSAIGAATLPPNAVLTGL